MCVCTGPLQTVAVQVWRAEYQGRAVALKLAGEANTDITDRNARYAQRELMTLRSLHHESIVLVRAALCHHRHAAA